MDKEQLSHLLHIHQASRDNRLVIFAGAGISANSGVPTWAKLVDSFRSELNDTTGYDDLKLAQFYKESRGHKEYMDKVKNVLKYGEVRPNDLHRSILALNPCHIITTNYDNAFEQEILKEFKQYAVVREDKDIPQIEYPNTLVKMHGDYDTDNIVLAEHDYLNYEKNFTLIRSFVSTLFASKLVVFVGFSFTDLNLRFILNDVRTILSDSMQKMYLISDEEPDFTTRKYFDCKGINIVHVSKEDLRALNTNEGTECTLTNTKGIYLNNILNAVNNYQIEHQEDVIRYAYGKICRYQSELRTLGYGLKSLFYNSGKYHFNYHSDGLQTFIPIIKEIKQSLSTYAGKRQFVKRYSDIDRSTIKKFARNNYLYEVDGLQLLDYNQYDICGFINEVSAENSYYSFNYVDLSTRMQELQLKSPTYSIDDLEYPFLLFKTGDYMLAYRIYDQLLSRAWNSHQYILYFICLYNIKSLRGALFSELLFQNKHNSSEILNRIDSIKLDVVINNLPLDEDIKEAFKRLISYQEFGENVIKTDKLGSELHKQRKHGERGGCSINSNVINLISLFERQFLFNVRNYIICDNNRYYKQICRNAIVGMLNSYATPETMFDYRMSCSKLEFLWSVSLFAMLFMIDKAELKEIFQQYEIDEIQFDEEALSLLRKYVANICEGKIGNKYKKVSKPFIQNLLFILQKTKNSGVSADSIYKVLLTYVEMESPVFVEKEIEPILNKYAITLDGAKGLFKYIMASKQLERFHDSIFTIVDKLKESDYIYREEPLTELFEKDRIKYTYRLYPIIEDSMKVQINVIIQENLKDFVEYMIHIERNHVAILSASKFDKFLSENLDDEHKNKNLYQHRVCRFLNKMLNDDLYSNVRDIITSHTDRCECLKFFIDPMAYEKFEAVQPEWILFNDSLSELVKKDVYREKIKTKLKTERLSKSDRDYLVSLL